MSKQQVSIFMGGTGANTVSDARTNLGVVARSGDTMTGNLNVAATLITQNVIPDANITYDLGSSEARFKDLWLSNSTIYLGEASISSNGNALVVPAMETTSGMNLEAEIAVVYAQANSAYDAANNRVLKAGDTMTGQLNISSGGLLVTGNVGIGTTDVPTQLTVGHGDHGIGLSYLGSANLPAIAGIFTDSVTGQTGYGSLQIKARTDFGGFYSVNFWTSAVDNTPVQRMIINSIGNVGIGTTSPASKIHAAFTNTTAPTSGTTPSGIGVSFGDGDGNNGGIWFSGTLGGDQGISGIAGTRVSGYTTDLRFYTNNTSSARAFTERARITSDGNVGIGTSSPLGKLHVEGSGGQEPIALFSSTNNDVSIRLLGGNVGNPDEVYIEFADRNDATNSFTIGLDDDSGKLFFGYGTLGTMNGHTAMTLNASGNLGVGTTSPFTKLTVAGTTISDADISLYTTNTSGGTTSRLSFRRNYTIGNTTPFVAAYIANHNFDDSNTSSNRQGLAFFTKSGTAEPVERMRIDGDGRITTPYQPAFRAYLSTDWTTIGVPDSGWTEQFDTGNNFNQGTFTAPVSGTYLFSVMWDSLSTQGQVELFKNGQGYVRWEPTGLANDSWESHHYCSHVYLSTNDYVYLRLSGGSGSNPMHMGSGVWGHFSGHLVG